MAHMYAIGRVWRLLEHFAPELQLCKIVLKQNEEFWGTTT